MLGKHTVVDAAVVPGESEGLSSAIPADGGPAAVVDGVLDVHVVPVRVPLLPECYAAAELVKDCSCSDSCFEFQGLQ